jgi:3-oxoacyl-[acyl-carrier-protein] synthase-1
MEVLQRLDSAGRLKAGQRRDGYLPGEAAAFLVIEEADRARRRGVRSIARVLATATAKEPTAGTDRPCQGEGLSAAIREVLERTGTVRSPLVVCDLNGERYRTLEWGIVHSRLAHLTGGFADTWHPADCIGDSGAASGAVDAAWAITALGKGYGPSAQALLWGASDGELRGAAMIARADGN